MKIKITRLLLVLTVTVCFVTTSCNKLIDVSPPIDALNRDKVFSNEGTALAALNGIYIQLTSSGLSFGNSQITITGGLSADELTLSTTNAVYNEFLNNSITPGNTSVTSLWSNPYLRIYQCNAIVENTKNSSGLSADLKNRLIGEAEFMRAYVYFYLSQMFGDVPLVLSTDYTQTSSLPRTPKIQVYNQIISDLKDASSTLATDPAGDKTRPTKWSAEALLARVYIFQKNWSAAANVSEDVINSGKYQLVPNLNNVFLANSDEALMQIAPIDGNGYTWEGFYFIPKGTAIPGYVLTADLISSFENGDNRKSKWIGSKTANGKTYNYPYKYKVGSGTGTPTEYYMVLRLAEQYLVHAEAVANNGDLKSALDDLDKVRSRAGLVLYSSDGVSRNQAQVLSLIETERRHELFCEWGHRWFDLNRTGRTLEVLGILKPAIKATAQLFPIPFSQIQRNPALVQNPGY